jgi:glucose/arabinose dehydrogenase
VPSSIARAVVTRALLPVVATSLVAGACISTPPDPSGQSGETAPATSSRPIVSTAGRLSWEEVVQGLRQPTAFVDAGDGRFYVTEQAGRVRVIQDGTLLDEPLIDISDHVLAHGERGLLGIALHPDYAANGRYFLMYSNVDGHTELREYGPASEPRNGQNIGLPPPSGEPPAIPGKLLLLLPQYRIWHKGGDITFGPDGYLYVSVGEDGRQDYEPTDPRELRGVILRLDVDDDQAWRYAIPSDNPFAESGGAPEIWDFGLRNPWRMSFDRETGDLYIADVGQATYEEINRHPADQPAPLDFGWIRTEGPDCREEGCATEGITFPLVAYDHESGDCAVVGGYVVRTNHVLEGRYLYGDLCSGRVWSVDPDDPDSVELEMETGYRISSFGQDNAGNIYVLAHFENGRLFRIVEGN